eukprot:6346707-Amphidinium_carterae.2
MGNGGTLRRPSTPTLRVLRTHLLKYALQLICQCRPSAALSIEMMRRLGAKAARRVLEANWGGPRRRTGLGASAGEPSPWQERVSCQKHFKNCQSMPTGPKHARR